MKKSLRQSITGYHMPMYLQDILINHYCPNFLEMTVVDDKVSYTFYYETGIYKKLDYKKLGSSDRFRLLLTLMTVIFENYEWLIGAENYLIEPELIYSINNSVDYGRVRILFYPDFKCLDSEHKLALFADKLKPGMEDRELGVIDRFKAAILNNDRFNARRILEKNIDRLEESQVV